MKIKEILSDAIVFDNDTILGSFHETDCHEQHWLDFSLMRNYNIATTTGATIDIYQQEFDFSNGVPFKKVDGLGILLYDADGNKYLINGYGSNNGYYSTKILLMYSPVYENYHGRKCVDEYEAKYVYNVSDCQKIEWC